MRPIGWPALAALHGSARVSACHGAISRRGKWACQIDALACGGGVTPAPARGKVGTARPTWRRARALGGGWTGGLITVDQKRTPDVTAWSKLARREPNRDRRSCQISAVARSWIDCQFLMAGKSLTVMTVAVLSRGLSGDAGELRQPGDGGAPWVINESRRRVRHASGRSFSKAIVTCWTASDTSVLQGLICSVRRRSME
jgi:hypothetical protein